MFFLFGENCVFWAFFLSFFVFWDGAIDHPRRPVQDRGIWGMASASWSALWLYFSCRSHRRTERNLAIVEQCPILQRCFVPAPWLTNRHLQSFVYVIKTSLSKVLGPRLCLLEPPLPANTRQDPVVV